MPQKLPRVYAIAGGGLVNIGTSPHVGPYMQTMRKHSPVPLEWVASCVGDEREERALHLLFADVRDHDEWFRLSDGDIMHLKEILNDEDALSALVLRFKDQLPVYLKRSSVKDTAPRRRGVGTYAKSKRRGRVKTGTIVQCNWCTNDFSATKELQAYCSHEHRSLAIQAGKQT